MPRSSIQAEMLKKNTLTRIPMALLLANFAVMHSIPVRAWPQSAKTSDAVMRVGSGTDRSGLPDAPEPALPRRQSSSTGLEQTSQSEPEQGKQTKRILGVFPNFRSVSANSQLPAQSPKEKFTEFREDSFDYSSFILIAALSGVSQLQGSTPEYHTGPAAYGRYYWHNFVDQVDENFWVEFLLPSALHQDGRYYTLGSGSAKRHNGFAKRAEYALSRVAITRSDYGRNSFNYSEVVGAGTSAGIANAYHPSSDRGWTETGERWGLNLGIDGGSFILKEFWPDINRAIFHNKW